jgi:hypothetical protein
VLDGIYRLPGWLVVAIGLVLFSAAALAARGLAERRANAGRRARMATIAAPLTPAFAALFSVMIAFTVVAEAQHLRTVQSLANDEAAAAARLAWAATASVPERARIQSDLAEYLDAVIAVDWGDRDESGRTPARLARATQRLETAARGAARGLTSPEAAETLSALDAVTTLRRQLVAESSRTLPAPYLLVLLLTGLALVVNVSVLTLGAGRRALWLIPGIVVVVVAALSLLVGISAPLSGPLQLSPMAIERVAIDLRAGLFRLAP